ncbi:sugar phosphate isomerase/epimerase [Ktedonosporobacter rubrisoli]|uniref:Sugar phosphate isomerase/epimerase n=1 Tax=Ktedonosporobacter rubrisoli TaxID=2509675 RepID=A0A4P6JPW7_KTERU|nr:sugar phosphate isomerase/epimerase family protein [Ktedonosporobacter rubrisoli]QBD77142.1 sugar phosphate isomerase/epimerase [Ktedonosporobacter rubrisoli]
MKLGVFTQWIKADSIEELALRIRQLGLQCVVLDSFPGLPIDLDNPTPAICSRIKAAFAQAKVEIAAVGGYSNLAHPDPQIRQAIHTRFQGLIRLSAAIGAPMLCTEVGTYDAQDEWNWNPANATEQALNDLIASVRPLVAYAQDYGVLLGIEPYVMTIINTPQRAVSFVEALDIHQVRIVADPAGMLTRGTLDEQSSFLPAAFHAISPYIGLVHVEDCRPDPAGHFFWLPAGQGLLEYPLFMDLLLQARYDGPFILEHLSEAALPAAREYVLSQWKLANERAGQVQL